MAVSHLSFKWLYQAKTRPIAETQKQYNTTVLARTNRNNVAYRGRGLCPSPCENVDSRANHRRKTDRGRRYTDETNAIVRFPDDTQAIHRRYTDYRRYIDDTHAIHRRYTDDTQTIHRRYTDDTQTIHRRYTDDTQTIHRRYTDEMSETQTIHS